MLRGGRDVTSNIRGQMFNAIEKNDIKMILNMLTVFCNVMIIVHITLSSKVFIINYFHLMSIVHIENI